MIDTQVWNIVWLIVGWILGILSFLIGSIGFEKYKESKIKRNLACLLKGEININLNSIERILNEELGWKFENKIFEKFFDRLIVFESDLSMKIIYFYYTLMRKNEEFKELENITVEDMVRFKHNGKWDNMIREWVEIQKIGHNLSDKLKKICEN